MTRPCQSISHDSFVRRSSNRISPRCRNRCPLSLALSLNLAVSPTSSSYSYYTNTCVRNAPARDIKRLIRKTNNGPRMHATCSDRVLCTTWRAAAWVATGQATAYHSPTHWLWSVSCVFFFPRLLFLAPCLFMQPATVPTARARAKFVAGVRVGKQSA